MKIDKKCLEVLFDRNVKVLLKKIETAKRNGIDMITKKTLEKN